jgi:hypothetical protein
LSRANKLLISCPDPLTPILPERPLSWKGVPLFHIELFSKDFSGTLYFVLGQGLGDHVNGFRIVHEVKKRFSKAICIVYADMRWEELVLRVEGIQIRWYPKAKDVLSKTGTNNPYDSAHETIRDEIKLSDGQAFLAYGHFPLPDRHARNETTLESTARAIGLRLTSNARPFLPVLASDLLWAENYLAKHGLKKGSFAIVSPYSWPNKIWGKENFSKLIDLLLERLNLRTIVASYPEIGLFENKGVVCAFDLTLGQLAGLMSFAGLYVGLDSGPSHMAAFFDSPMVVIFVERRTIPFEVKPLSPQAIYVVESFFSQEPFPQVTTVFDAASLIFKRRQVAIKDCPVCDLPMNYVVESNGHTVRMMCICGLSLDLSINDSFDLYSDRPSFSQARLGNRIVSLEKDIESLENFYQFDQEMSDSTQQSLAFTISYRLGRYRKKIDCISVGRLKLNFDSLIFWMEKKGYRPTAFKRLEENYLVTFRKAGEPSVKSEWLWIPWGEISIYSTIERYLRWYSYSQWEQVESLVGIVKSQSELGFEKKEMLACAWTAFRSNMSVRSFRWVIKSFFMGYIKLRMKS